MQSSTADNIKMQMKKKRIELGMRGMFIAEKENSIKFHDS